MAAVKDIIDAIERYAPPALQENWDNTGLQIGHRDMEVTGVLTCVDVTPERIDEAVSLGANMIVSHHPLLFRGLKNVTGDSNVQLAVEKAIVNGVAIYSSHTATDSTVGGVSAVMAENIGAKVVSPLVPSSPGAQTGLGVVAELPESVAPDRFVEMAKQAFGNAMVRTSNLAVAPRDIRRIAMCGGAGDDLIDRAIAAGAQAYVTGELRYHHFVDYAPYILLVDCGHYETECATRTVFKNLLKNEFPNLKIIESATEINPVTYI